MHGLEGNWTPYGGMQIPEELSGLQPSYGKDSDFGAFSFDITQANTTLADGTRHSGQSVDPGLQQILLPTRNTISRSQDIAILRKVFITLLDSAYSGIGDAESSLLPGNTNRPRHNY